MPVLAIQQKWHDILGLRAYPWGFEDVHQAKSGSTYSNLAARPDKEVVLKHLVPAAIASPRSLVGDVVAAPVARPGVFSMFPVIDYKLGDALSLLEIRRCQISLSDVAKSS